MNLYHWSLVLSTYLFFYVESFDLQNVTVWGPGLKPADIVMPARYFFIDTNLNTRLTEMPFEVQIQGSNVRKKPCRLWISKLDRKDGSYIIRYKVYETCYNMKIVILHKGMHVGESPYNIKHGINPDECYCPLKDFNQWSNAWKCGDVPQQIKDDLTSFSKINFIKYRKKIIERFNNPSSNSLCHYVILNNTIHRQCYGKYVGFKMFMDSILLSLTRKLHLPNVEMFVNLGDWPLIQKSIFSSKNIMPMFSWCGSDDSYDIVMPTYDITESTLENMGRVTLDMLSMQGNTDYMWNERIPKIFWRGRDSNRQRLKLIEISREHPDLFNASLTNFFFFRDEEEKYGPKTDHVSLFKFLDYKYQLNIDGTVAAYRLPYLLAGGSLLFKQQSKYYEHFYKSLVPYEHYVPVKIDLSDLLDQLEWAMNSDEEAHRIAIRGQQFARENLLPQNIFCYYAHLLNEWSKMLENEVEVLEGMELVAQPTIKEEHCDCDKLEIDNISKKDEL